MKKQIAIVLIVLFGVLLAANFIFAEEVRNKDAVDSSLYVCANNCGKCSMGVLKTPGKCGCGHDLVPVHAVKIEGKEAIVCSCGKDCTCKIDDKDPLKCGCGKPVRRVNIEGMYVCNCGHADCCLAISDKAGECKCGKPLKKVQ